MDYLDAGWHPMPLPNKAKDPPPKDFTGWDYPANKINRKQVKIWLAQNGEKDQRNIALRLPRDILMIDVDAYKEEGEESLAALEEAIGVPLPPTWRNSPRADGISGHYFFRYEPGPAWPNKLAPGIDAVHFGHRYVVAAPSVHPDRGKENGEADFYRWYAPGAPIDGNGTFDIPDPDEIPELPPEWIEYITAGLHHRHFPKKDLGGKRQAQAAVQGWIEDNTHDEVCARMRRCLDDALAELPDHNPHDTIVGATFQLMAFGCEGHGGLRDALEELESSFYAELSGDDSTHSPRSPRDMEAEWGRQLDDAAKKMMFRQEEGEFEGFFCDCPALDEAGEPLHEINVAAFKLSDEVDECYGSVAPTDGGTGEGVYLFADQMSEYRGGKLSVLNKHSLRVALDRAVFCFKMTNMGETSFKSPAAPPDTLVEGMLADSHRRDFLPLLDRIARTPFYALDSGTPVRVDEPGYHDQYHVFLDADPDMLDAMQKVDPKHVGRAVQMLEEDLLGDFPFEGDADRAGIIGAMLVPFVRELITGPTPLHLIGAPSPRSGKTLLADVIAAIALGRTRNGLSFMSPPRSNADEWMKKLTAALLTLPTMVVLDNVNGKLSSGPLAMALTHETFEDRILGGSVQATMPNRALWVATANNIKASDEIAERMVPSIIDSGIEHPGRGRKFRHPNLLEWTHENRHALVWALMTMVEAWIEADCPNGKEELGGFESWSRVIGGILMVAGVDGLLTNQADFLQSAEDESNALREVLEFWQDAKVALGRKEALPARDLYSQIAGLDDVIELGTSRPALAFGKWLGSVKNRPVDGWVIRSAYPKGTAKWWIEEV